MINSTDDQLIRLAQTNPKELAIRLNRPNTDIRTLTSGAEILGGEVKEENIVIPVLNRLLKHINAGVREGALIGLSSFYMDKKPCQDILDKLDMMSKNDPSINNKELAKNLLQDFNKMMQA